MKTRSLGVVAALAIFAAASAHAQVTQTFGAGSAVTNLQGSASFEDPSSLSANPYTENGLSFTRTGLTFDNNGCGYGGSGGDPACGDFPGFVGFFTTGNYMYGTGTGYFSMFAPTGQSFQGLEFILGSGFDQTTMSVQWQAFLGGNQIDAGATTAAVGQTIGFSSATGFDQLNYTEDFNNFSAPAFDEVRAQYNGNVVSSAPEPGTLVLMVSGLVAIGGAGMRRKRKSI